MVVVVEMEEVGAGAEVACVVLVSRVLIASESLAAHAVRNPAQQTTRAHHKRGV